MANYQVRIVLPFASDLPADVAVNTWSVIGPDPLTEAMGEAFIDFYNLATPTTTDSVCEYLSGEIKRATDACRAEIYEVDLAGGPSGSPIAVVNFTLGAIEGTSDNLPPECALCTSFASATPPGTVAARRRGRVYLGPLNGNCNGEGRVNNSFVTTVAEATERLASDLVAEGATLSVWSRTDAAMFPVTRGFVDNAFDTIRARGVNATNRETWTL